MINFNCSEDYKKATRGITWKTAGDDVQYSIVKEGNTIYVHYQCSMSKRDWINNFNIFPKRIKPMDRLDRLVKANYIYVHRGLWNAFTTAWCTVYQELLPLVKQSGEDTIVRFDGHSYGGAMAIFSAYAWKRQTVYCKNINKVISSTIVLETWGAPRVCFNAQANEDIGRAISYDIDKVVPYRCHFACYNDLVARMPPFYKKYIDTKYVGEKFNLFKMLTKAEYYHTCYGEIDER